MIVVAAENILYESVTPMIAFSHDKPFADCHFEKMEYVKRIWPIEVMHILFMVIKWGFELYIAIIMTMGPL